jgi:hypothetical protein
MVAGVSCAFALAACGTATQFTSTWSDPAGQPVAANQMHIATVFFNGNESVRRESEDVMAEELAEAGTAPIASYRIISENPNDREVAKRMLEEAGVDAVLSMRVVRRERTFSVSPDYWAGSPYGSLWGYWTHGWGSLYEAGYMTTDIVISVETLLYSLRDGKLLWAGMSETIDPDDVEDAVRSIADKAIDKMLDENVLVRF